MTDPGFSDIGRLLNPNGVIPAAHLLVSALSAVFALAIPALRKPSSLLFVCAVATAAIYRRSLFGYLLTNAIVFLFMLVLDRAASRRDQKSRFRWRWTCAAIPALIFAFLFGRSWQLDTRGPSVGGIQWVLFSLDMWLVLRLITILWEFGSGRVRRPDIHSYSIWIGFPFISFGPIIRYSQFDPQLSSRERVEVIRKTFSTEWLGKFLIAILQIVAGVVLSNLHQMMYASGGGGLPLWVKLLDAFGIVPWAFLFVWGGYYKLMECLALMWGVTLPPSFNRPFGRSNISKFWANWNMTVTSVFRDYLFYNRWGRKSFNIYFNTLLLFILVGLWHSTNWYWALWGGVHGVGFCVYLWYKKHKERFHLELPQLFEGQGTVLGAVVTYLYVCAAWVIPSQLIKFFKNI